MRGLLHPSTSALYLSLPCNISLPWTLSRAPSALPGRRAATHWQDSGLRTMPKESPLSAALTLHARFRILLCVYSLQFRRRLALDWPEI